jgi:transcriptional regulator with XRE-family HTH domain
MISPYVRRLRLGMELRVLRAEHNYTQARVARIIGKSRMEISRLENGQSADLADVLNILEGLGVEGDQWTTLEAIARDACTPGWWDSVKHIGDRQALSANLEAGAAIIRQYQQTYLPGLLQLPEFIRSIYQAPAALEPLSGTVEGFLAGRMGRQRNLRRPGGPSLEAIVDEFAIQRLAAPAGVVKRQLRRLAEVGKGVGQVNVTLRVLPIQALIRDFTLPRCSFSIYAYPDPGDPRVVAIDTVTSDVILTDAAQVTPYARLYERLAEAALTPEESAKLLTEAADALPDN